MLLADHFTGAHVVDGRAHLRDIEAPTAVSLVSLGDGSTADLVEMCLAVQPMPCALVLDDGRVWLLTAGGSGMIAHAGHSVNDDQRPAIAALEQALYEMGATPMPDEVEIDEAKPKRRRKVETEAIEPEPEPEVIEPEPDVEDAPF